MLLFQGSPLVSKRSPSEAYGVNVIPPEVVAQTVAPCSKYDCEYTLLCSIGLKFPSEVHACPGNPMPSISVPCRAGAAACCAHAAGDISSNPSNADSLSFMS